MVHALTLSDSCTRLAFTDNMMAVESIMEPAKRNKLVARVIFSTDDMEQLIKYFVGVLAWKKCNGTYGPIPAAVSDNITDDIHTEQPAPTAETVPLAAPQLAGRWAYCSEPAFYKEQSATKAVKHDSDKPKFDLLPWEALESVAHVMTYGAAKYGAHNWRAGLEWGRLFGACLRHMSAYWRGEDNDKESGLPHLAHAAACVLMLLSSVITGRGKDDRHG